MDDFRYDPSDPESKGKLDALLARAGFELPESSCDELRHYLPRLVWREAASSLENEGGFALTFFLDLGEGDLMPLGTLRAGERTNLRELRHTGKDTR